MRYVFDTNVIVSDLVEWANGLIDKITAIA